MASREAELRSAEWYHSDGDSSEGPHTFGELSHLLGAGIINEGTFVWRDVEPALDWLPLKDPTNVTLLTMLRVAPGTNLPPVVRSREKGGALTGAFTGDTSDALREAAAAQAAAANPTIMSGAGSGGGGERLFTSSGLVDSGEDRFVIDVRTGEQVFIEQGTNRKYRLSEGGAKLYDDLKPKKVYGGGGTWQTSQVQADANKGAVGAGQGGFNRPGRV